MWCLSSYTSMPSSSSNGSVHGVLAAHRANPVPATNVTCDRITA
ncbi:hypothetical protein MINT15_24770 [Saccharomonospora viridis]|uniref:Uncharacterized protein n=1 Tax=Saccharomonospora viridis TaxID=1852 RepID=A0A837D8K0_9PSEU|nr:hypothetical protein MINT15_24770 [Saccharomonospora viridis]